MNKNNNNNILVNASELFQVEYVSDVGTLSWLPTSRMRRVQCLWHWISVSPTNVSEVALTLVLMDTYTTRNNRPSNTISFMTAIVSTAGCLHSEFVLLLFLQTHRETDSFFTVSREISLYRFIRLTIINNTSVRMMYLSVCDIRDRTCTSTPSPSPRSSLTYVHRCIVTVWWKTKGKD